MAILDNSGDIILDAVLTDVGRRRMANGNFSIVKFALGDDEIDYRLFNRNHPSGSAYFDLEILQTPVFEAITAQNAAINYGLLSITNRSLLYMPVFKTNEVFPEAAKKHNGVYYLAVNSETYSKLNIASALGTAADKTLAAGVDGRSGYRMIYVESGIDTAEIPATAANRTTYLTSLDLLDTSTTIQVDNRFINGVFGNSSTVGAASAGASSDTEDIPGRATACSRGGMSRGLNNYFNYSASPSMNLLYAPTSGTRTDKSVIAGARGIVQILNFSTPLNAASTATRPIEFTQHGKVSQNLFSDGNTYDYIDTTVRIIGNSSTLLAQLPIRIIRFAG